MVKDFIFKTGPVRILIGQMVRADNAGQTAEPPALLVTKDTEKKDPHFLTRHAEILK